jgi:hypothetical protein
LQQIIQTINFTYDAVYFTFSVLHFLGKSICELLVYVYSLLATLLINISNIITIIYQDYSLFLTEVNESVNGFFQSIFHGFLETVHFGKSTAGYVKDRLSTGNLKFSNFGLQILRFVTSILTRGKNLLIFIGDSFYLMVTIVPNLLLVIYQSLRRIVRYLTFIIWEAVVNIWRSIYSGLFGIIYFILDFPLKSGKLIYLKIKYFY